MTLSQASGYGGHTREPSAEGEHYEWQFAQMGAYAFLIETGTEFQPPYQSALAEAALVWPGILAVLEREISVRGHVKDVVTGAPLAAKIEILNVAFSQGETNASGGAYGAYHMFLPAGTYNLRFSAAGYIPVVRTVSVTDCVPAGQNCSTVAEIQMAREGTPPPPPPRVRPWCSSTISRPARAGREIPMGRTPRPRDYGSAAIRNRPARAEPSSSERP